jgi:prepilin-type N-terminal cleavage/methylation domain-containing protein
MLKKGEAGFTLIELMIVILVILILAAILVPQFGLAQERARKAKCVSNQRNLETSVAMWSTDNTSVIYTGGTMNASVPSYVQLTSSPQYALSGAFQEPDDPTAGNANGTDYYLSAGAATGQTASASAPSYGHVSCAADKTADPWVNNYDGTAGTVNNINHTRGAAASP